MKLASYTVGLAILWSVMYIAADETVDITLKSSAEIRFSKSMYTNFYNCLCAGTAINILAHYKKGKKNTVESISSNVDNQNDASDCKYYKCKNNLRNNIFTCTYQEQHTCTNSSMCQYLKMPDDSCGSNKCVALFKDIIKDIDYNGVRTDVKNCENRFTCSTTALSTATTTQSDLTTSSTPALKSTVKSTTTAATSLSSKRIRSTSTRKGTSTRSSESATKSMRITTETNITLAKLASNSHDKLDNTDVIIGVIVSLGIIVIVAVIVIVYLWRRKKRSVDKHSSQDHDYANIVKTTASSQKEELQPLPNINANVSSQYYNCVDDNVSSPYYSCVADNEDTETYTLDSVNNLDKNPQFAVTDGANKLKHDFVYSITGSSENTSAMNKHLIRDTSSASVDNVDNTTATHSSNYSIVSKPKRNPKPTMNKPITCNSITGTTECSPQKDTKGITFCTTDSQDNRLRFGHSQNGEDNTSSQYYTIEPAYNSSNLNSMSPIGKVAKENVHTAHKNDPSPSPNAIALTQQSSQSDPPVSHGANENVEYSFARIPHEQEQHNVEQSNVYAKLHDDPSKIQNLYDHLLQPNQTITPTCNEMAEDTEYSIARLPYSTENPTNNNQESEQSNVYSKLRENPRQVTNIYDH